MDLEYSVRSYKDRIRILLILYFFGEPYSNASTPDLVRVFKTETRIQKIDFLLRNPDYLAYELLVLSKSQPQYRLEIKAIVQKIFKDQEPVLRRLEMERFFFGAYEDIDDVISFLKGIDFIDFSSKKSADLKTIDKHYYITSLAEAKILHSLQHLSALSWYRNRCELIYKYFGDLSANQLKLSQYQIPQYRETTYNKFIGDIEQSVKNEYLNLYSEAL